MFSLNMLIDGMSEFRIASEPDRHLFFDLLLICPPSREEEHMLEPADEPKPRATKPPQPTRFPEFDETAESGSGTTLFVGGPSESLSFLEANADAYACILQNEAEPFSGNHRELMSRCYVLIASDPFPSALLKIQQAHNRIQLWQDRMKTELIHHESYQRLLDCSESMLSNFVSITDYSFQLLAFTKTIEPSDGVSQRLIRNGYHDLETIEIFRRNNLFKTWEKENGLKIHENPLTTDTESASYIFRLNGAYFIHIVMRFNKRPRTKGLVDTFKVFVNHVEILVRKDWIKRKKQGPAFAKTLTGLCTGKLDKQTVIEEELVLAGIPKEARFSVLAFSPSAFPEELLPSERHYYQTQLAMEFPRDKMASIGNKFILLHEHTQEDRQNDPVDDQREETLFLSCVAAFLNAHGGLCGLSDPVESAFEIRFAYLQALYALSHRSALPPSLEKKPFPPITVFRECLYDFLLVGRSNKELYSYLQAHSLIERIERDDSVNNTNNMDVLITYLYCERKVSIAARTLFMHRNSFLYRIESLQKKYRLDFDSFLFRQAFLAEYSIRKQNRTS